MSRGLYAASAAGALFPAVGRQGAIANSGVTGSTGWAASSGGRLIGSGMGVTTLQLTGASSGNRYVVGMNFDSGGGFLTNGFELTDMTLDGALASNLGANVGAVLLRGNGVYVRRIRAINYGTNSLGTVPVITGAGENSSNCVVEECTIDPPPASHSGKAIWFSFEDGSGTNGHRFCTIRNCAGRGNLTYDPPQPLTTTSYAAIAPRRGLGTVLEGNQFVHVYLGVLSSGTPAKDIVIWNNFFRNVQTGLYWTNLNTAGSVGRVIALDNIIELNRVASAPVGIQLIGGVANTFADLILRRNIIRQVVDSNPLASAIGITVSGCTRLIAENNLINKAPFSGVGTGATGTLLVNNCGSFKFFNNQDDSGNLERGYNALTGATAVTVQELADAVQDVLLPI